MNKVKVILFAAALAATGAAFGQDDTRPGGVWADTQAMDTNHDGKISKREYMRYHEKMWRKMDKNSAGWVSRKDMDDMLNGKPNHETGELQSDKR